MPAAKDIITPSGWPAVVEDATDRAVITRSLTIDEIKGIDPEVLGALELSPRARRTLAQKAGFLGLLDEAVA